MYVYCTVDARIVSHIHHLPVADVFVGSQPVGRRLHGFLASRKCFEKPDIEQELAVRKERATDKKSQGPSYQ
jgi:hypothetical protein